MSVGIRRSHVLRRYVRWHGRLRVAAVACCTGLVLAGPASATHGDHQDEPAELIATLSLDGTSEVFWPGGEVIDSRDTSMIADGSRRPRVEECGERWDCFSYLLDVAGPVPAGARLRVAASNMRSWIANTNQVAGDAAHNGYDLRILRHTEDPETGEVRKDEVARSTWTAAYDLAAGGPVVEYPGVDQEAVVVDPQPGSYEVKLIAHYVCGKLADGGGCDPQDEGRDDPVKAVFEMRAKLQKPFFLRGPARTLLPDLRAQPAWNFEWYCKDEELHADAPRVTGEHDCLRFSFGYENAGDGPLDLRFRPPLEGVTQYVYVQDETPEDYDDNLMSGKVVQHDAGDYEFHPQHGHYHYAGMYTNELYRVEKGRMVGPVSAGKRGNCGSDWFMADFHRFNQDRTSLADSHGCTGGWHGTTANVRIGLSTGWGDYYHKNTPDNYIAFDGKSKAERAGEYVLRTTVNPGAEDPTKGSIRERRYGNNTAYTHFRIGPAGVPCLLERGRGDSPWDPSKQLLPLHAPHAPCD